MSFNVGKDVTVDFAIVDPVSQQQVSLISFGIVKNFKKSMAHETTKVEGVNNSGEVAARDSFHGWNLSFTVTRQNGMLDKLAQIYQDTYLNGGKQILATFTETVRNQNGTIDQYQYARSVCNFGELGSYDGGGKEVDQSFTAFCPKRTELKAPTVLG